MIDRAARVAAVSVLQDLRFGRMLPSEFERLWPRKTEDLGVRSIGYWVWTLFDDDSGDPVKVGTASEEEKILDNSIEFLTSDRVFEPRRSGILYKAKTILTGGTEWMGCELPWHMKWPFPPSVTSD